MKELAPRAASIVARSPLAFAGVVPQVHGALRPGGDLLETLDHLLIAELSFSLTSMGADEAVDRQHVGALLDHQPGQRRMIGLLRATSPERSCFATLILISPLALTISRSPMSAGVKP